MGLKQYIDTITRPNKKGGSSIDLIMTDCMYIDSYSTLDDFVSGHFSVFCVRKKQKERNNIVRRAVRDYSAFNQNVFENLLKNKDWGNFDQSMDPDRHWEILTHNINTIIMIMCLQLFKNVNTRKVKTQEIYQAMRGKKPLLKNTKWIKMRRI